MGLISRESLARGCLVVWTIVCIHIGFWWQEISTIPPKGSDGNNSEDNVADMGLTSSGVMRTKLTNAPPTIVQEKDSTVVPTRTISVYDSGNKNKTLANVLDDEAKASYSLPSRIPTSTESKPLFVLHVGPAKSGTTSFQYALQTLEEELHQDGYSYAGLFLRECSAKQVVVENHPCYRFGAGQLSGMLTSVSCMEREASADKKKKPRNKTITKCWSTFRERLKQNVNVSHHVIFSNEVLAKYSVHAEGLIDDRDVRVVIGYRRLWDWAPSRWNQDYKSVRGSGSVKWRSCYDNEEMPPIAEWLKDTMKDKKSSPLRLWTRRMVQRYQEQFPVYVMNAHDSSSTVVTFLCDMLPGAYKACQEATSRHRATRSLKKHHDLTSSIRNPSTPIELDYEAIVCAAVRKGLMKEADDTRYPRVGLLKAIKTFHEVELDSPPLPLHCADNQTLEHLWNETLRYEEEIIPDFYHTTDQELHRQDFLTAIANNRFCSVNVTAVLRDKRWKKFFKRMRRGDAASMQK